MLHPSGLATGTTAGLERRPAAHARPLRRAPLHAPGIAQQRRALPQVSKRSHELQPLGLANASCACTHCECRMTCLLSTNDSPPAACLPVRPSAGASEFQQLDLACAAVFSLPFLLAHAASACGAACARARDPLNFVNQCCARSHCCAPPPPSPTPAAPPCSCFVCDVQASACASWGSGSAPTHHCNAHSGDPLYKSMRAVRQQAQQTQQAQQDENRRANIAAAYGGMWPSRPYSPAAPPAGPAARAPAGAAGAPAGQQAGFIPSPYVGPKPGMLFQHGPQASKQRWLLALAQLLAPCRATHAACTHPGAEPPYCDQAC